MDNEKLNEGTGWEQFVDEGDNVLWISSAFVEHLEAVLKKLPKESIDKLRDRQIVTFAPDRRFSGGLCLDLRGYDEDRIFIYLSPDLLNNPDDQIRHIIAHELAHAFLGHTDEPTPDAALVAEINEDQADKLAAQWGFPKPEPVSKE